jgi:hypothetical protein
MKLKGKKFDAFTHSPYREAVSLGFFFANSLGFVQLNLALYHAILFISSDV